MHAPETTHHLSVRIPKPVYRELARRADREGSPVSSVTRRLLADAVAGRPASDVRVGDGDAAQLEGAR